MACGKTLNEVQVRVVTTTTVEQFQPVTAWLPAMGIDAVKMVVKRKSVQLAGTAPTMQFKLAVQTAVVRPDNPDDWTAIAGFGPWTGVGETNSGVMSLTGVTPSKGFVRFGVSFYLAGTAPTQGQADVGVTVSYPQCGAMVGAATNELLAFNTTTDSYLAVTGWIPAIEADKVMATFVLSDVAGNFRCQLAMRTAATSVQTPSAWSNLEGAGYRSTNNETASTEITLSLGGQMFVQFGVAYSQSTAGAAPGTATVSTSVSARRT